MDLSLTPFDPSSLEIDWEMPVEVMRDFDTTLLFGKLTAVSSSDLTLRRMSSEVCFPIIEEENVVLVRCYDARVNPILLRARVIRSSGIECAVGRLELLPYKTQRKYVRYPLYPPAAISVLDEASAEPPQPCQLLNISVCGACIVAKRSYAVGQALQLRLRTGECAPVPCTVIRMTPRRGGCFEYGLSFAPLSKSQRGRLANALRGQLHICFGTQGGFGDE